MPKVELREGDITAFWGDHRYLSNFYPCKIKLDDVIYPSVEHAYQAAKTLDKEERKQFADPDLRAGEAKRLGNYVTLRPNWDRYKLPIMKALVEQKFYNSKTLTKQLIDTGNVYIIEGNDWGDTYWGESPVGTGQNQLGHILMRLRAKLQAIQKGAI